GLVMAIGELLDKGQLQLYCLDGIDKETWSAFKMPCARAIRQNQFDGYLFNEVLPFSQKQNPNPQVIVAGMELGGYQAMNFGFRHPERVTRVLSMGGVADIRRFVDGYYDDSVYFNNPCDFLANEHEPARLQALRRLDIILVIGGADAEYPANLRLSEI